jgi:hypothetical protein
MPGSAPIALGFGSLVGGNVCAGDLATPLLESLVAANWTFIWYEKQISVHFFGSFAWRRRSRWGSTRGWPVFSSHLCPAAAPHVGHGTARLCLLFNPRIMVGIMRQKGRGRLFNFEQKRKKPPPHSRSAIHIRRSVSDIPAGGAHKKQSHCPGEPKEDSARIQLREFGQNRLTILQQLSKGDSQSPPSHHRILHAAVTAFTNSSACWDESTLNRYDALLDVTVISLPS